MSLNSLSKGKLLTTFVLTGNVNWSSRTDRSFVKLIRVRINGN